MIRRRLTSLEKLVILILTPVIAGEWFYLLALLAKVPQS